MRKSTKENSPLKPGKSLTRLIRYLRPYGWFVVGAVAMAALGSIFNLALPWLVKDMIDQALIDKNMRLLLFIASSIVIIFLVKGIASYIQSLWISVAGFRVIARLRSELYHHLHNLSASFFQNHPTGDVISRMTNDVLVLQNLFSNTFLNILMDILIFSGSVVILFVLHWKLALLSMLIFPLVGWGIDVLGKKVKGASHLLQSKTAVLTSLVERTISGMKIIQSYVTGRYETERFERENELNFNLAMKQVKAKAILSPLVELISSCGLTLVVWYGGREVIYGNLTPGGLIAFIGYLVTAANPLAHFSSGYQLLQQSLASAERIFEFLDITPQIQEPEEPLELKGVEQGIRFDRVSFSYQGEMVLKDFTLDIPLGRKVGIVGPSGAGKSTLINLLMRFYDPTQGKIEIDGIDIRRLKLSSLRNAIGVVWQDSLLMGGTVQDNILYGNFKASHEELLDASKKAHAHEFVEGLEKGYDSDVGENGSWLSGGQKQRIAIARALLKDPPILVFDEATSNLDPKSESYILDTISKIERDKIVIVIAHSLKMVRDLDQIVLLRDGKIEGIGSHQELLKHNPFYRELFFGKNYEPQQT
ncbi:MAG: ATP-binding cassette, subfamily bacterial MsbA [Candidatus Atribacteria bacterium]|nr:ATP-binding cassette, subfamily bacterial MsbA [Candidatus Atribacteria bacterium]